MCYSGGKGQNEAEIIAKTKPELIQVCFKCVVIACNWIINQKLKIAKCFSDISSEDYEYVLTQHKTGSDYEWILQ